MDFKPFPKVPRLSREMIITEKLDGTNASVWIETDAERFVYREHKVKVVTQNGMSYTVSAGSRKKFLSPGGTLFTGESAKPVKGTDNFGFAAWVHDNAEELVALGEGVHYGEWWGHGIQRNYGLKEKRFSLFNVGRWLDPHIDPVTVHDGDVQEDAPPCCHVVPVLYRGPFAEYTDGGMTGWHVYTDGVSVALQTLSVAGSVAAPGFMNPEGIMIYHTAANQLFKKTFKGDSHGKESKT